MKAMLGAAALLLATALAGQESKDLVPLKLAETWKLFLNVEPPESWASAPSSLKAAGKDEEVKATNVKMNGDTLDLGALAGGPNRGACAVLCNEFQAAKEGTVKAGFSADYWMEVYVNGKLVLSTMNEGNGSNAYKPSDHVVSFKVKEGRNLLAAKVKSGSLGWRFVCGTPEEPKPNVKFEANDEWKAVDMSDPYVKEGSALDQSSLTEIPRGSGFLSKLGFEASARPPRLAIGPSGQLVEEERPDLRVKLRGTSINFPWILGNAQRNPNWKDVFSKEVVDAKRRGYNAIRMHPGLATKFSDTELDKADFFLAKLGENGLYCISDCFVDRDLFTPWEEARKNRRGDVYLRMYLGDEIVRSSWKRGTAFVMNHVNPYTGLAWKDDPAIAFMLLMNEQEWGFYRTKNACAKETQLELDVKFRQWLERKYNDWKTLAKAWNDPSIKSFAQIETPEKFPDGSFQAKDNDYILFCGDLSKETAEWMSETLRAAGYKGLIAQYNISHWLEGQEARWEESPMTIANSYHNHPSDFDRPGSRCGQDSSIGAGAWYWRGAACMRFADRPFVQTEYNHSFWNPYQHECGILFGAYSALQGFDGLNIHGAAVFYYVDRPCLSTFTVGKSPVSRAGELLLNNLFLRGDVKRSPHRLELQIPKDYLETRGNGARVVSSDQGNLAFMSGFSVAFPWAKPAAGTGKAEEPDLTLEPAGGTGFKEAGAGGAIDLSSQQASTPALDAFVARLKEKGILPKDNVSEPSKGIFQSDTGEITMRTKENLLKVATPRSEAVSLERGKGERVGLLNVVNTSVPGMIAACSVEKEDLANAKRIVLIYSTCAVNSGMELSADRRTLVKLGELPVLVQAGKLDMTLKNSNGAKMKLHALAFNGERREELPFKFENGELAISLDLGKLKNGPTPFFELVAE